MRPVAQDSEDSALTVKSAATAALNAELVDASGLGRLRRRLATIGSCELAGLLRVEADLEAAAAAACAWLVEHDKSNPNWLSWALAVGACPNTAPDALKWLAGADRWQLRRAVASNPALPADTLAGLSRDDSVGVRAALAGNPRLPHAAAAVLCTDAAVLVREVLGRRDGLDARILRRLAADPEMSVRSAVAENDQAPAGVLPRLARDHSAEVRVNAAQNPRAKELLLASMAGDPSEDVRIAVAHNLTTPATALEFLAQDGSQVVRAVVARNPNTAQEVLTMLASDPRREVQAAVGLSGRATPQMLETLASHNPGMLECVAEREGCVGPDQLRSLAAMGGDVGAGVATNTSTPPDVLTMLASDPNWTTRARVAHNRNTPPDVLRMLARDPDVDVRAAVAGNASTPLSVLKDIGTDCITVTEVSPPNRYAAASLATDNCGAIRWYVAEFSDCGDVLAAMANSQDSTVRSAVAGNAATPLSALAGLAADDRAKHQIAANPATPPRWLSRVLAFEAPKDTATNPATPTGTLTMLATDSDPDVRAAATESLKRRRMRRHGTPANIREAVCRYWREPEYLMRSGVHDSAECDRLRCDESRFEAQLRRSYRKMPDPFRVRPIEHHATPAPTPRTLTTAGPGHL